jgi:hypothetical protein
MTTPTTDFDTTGFINVGEALTTRWPAALPQLPEGSILDHLWSAGLQADVKEGIVRATGRLLVEDELVLSIPGVDAISIAIAAAHGGTMLPVEVTILPDFSITLERVPIALRLNSDLLRPARRVPGASAGDPPRWEPDATRDHLDITLAEVTITVNGDGDITVAANSAIDLPPCMIGDSGIVVEAHGIGLLLSADDPPPGQPAGWKGIHLASAALYLPGELSGTVGNLALTGAYIGNGGFTGAVSDTWTPALSTELFGMDVTLQRAEIDFVQNAPVTCELSGTLTLPFFDQPVGVDLQVGLDGSIGILVSATQPAGASNVDGLLRFTKLDLLTMQLDSLGFRFDDGVFTASLSGTLTPQIGDLDWPGFRVQELSIDSGGNVRLEGGWLNLPDQYSLDFHGFHVGITRLGMGSTDDGGRWIGFSGNIKLVDGLSIGGSVDGLRIAWYDDGRSALTLEGVGVELEIPETLRFKGRVSYHELPGPQHRFDGDVTLELLALDLRVDGKIVIGSDTNPATGEDYTFFALYIGVELPAGIPLWATGLGLYGVAGLVAIEMAPNKGAPPNALHPSSRADEEWFENLDGSPGWYKRPTVGVTDLRSKWDPLRGGFALGGGVTIGTLPDNGFTFNGSLLLVISFPGPVILLEGKANLLKERATLSDTPLFRALVVLDFRAGNFLVGLGAQYKFGSGGELIEIGGSAEAFFDFNDASRWHLYLGVKDPKERRIRAELLSLFEANAYFMLDASKLEMGAWVGYDARWDFGPLGVVVEAWIEGGVAVSRKPAYFHGDLWLHGKAELRVFGFGLGLSVDARFAADVFDPFHLLAEFSVGISLPWPLPDFDVGITLEWGPTPDEPALPVPLKEIAVEHFKSTASWPLPRAELLQPDLDAGDGFLAIPPPAAPLAAPPPTAAPVVPMDGRPHITFGRSVHDDALVGVNPQPVWPSAVPPGWERIGDPAANQGPMRVRFGVKEITLSRWDGTTWSDVARKASSPNPAGVKELFGSWAPMPQLPSGAVAPGTDPPVGQVKLWLWSKTPFDHSRHGGRAWDEWFTDRFAGYPCIPPVPERTICCDFDHIPVGAEISLAMPCRQHPEIVFVGHVRCTIEDLATPTLGHTHALCWESFGGPREGTRESLGILVDGDPARRMTLAFAAVEGRPFRECLDFERIGSEEVQLPWREQGATVRVFDRENRELHATVAREGNGRRGIDIGHQAEVALPCPAERVEVSVVQQASPVTVTALDVGGRVVSLEQGPQEQGFFELVLNGPGIAQVIVDAPQDETLLVEVCYECAAVEAPDVDAIAVDADGGQHGPFQPVGGTITVDVEKLRGVLIRGQGHVCLVQVCVTYPPDGNEVAAREEMARRLVDSMALWGDEGEVLDANTGYRLKVVTTVDAVGEGPLSGVARTHELTELAYFRTQGPPALSTLSTPVRHPPEEAFESGLEDLTRYVAQTVPPTVPARGQQPGLPRPVYRAYDVGAVFNEDYVDLIYRLAKRDLYLYLYDANNLPVRDAAGRLIVSANMWGVTESITLTEGEIRYLFVIDRSACASLDPTIIPRQVTMFAVDPGLVLEPDMLCEARLIPLLLHEDFRDGLGAWTVVDSGANQGPSNWSTPGHPTLRGAAATAAGADVTLTGAMDLSALDTAIDVVILSTDTARSSKTYRVVAVDQAAKMVTVDGNPTLSGGRSAWEVPGWGAVVQTSNVWGGDAAGVPKPGTLLVGGDAGWTDYRYSVQLRSGDDDAIGVVFRYGDPGNCYRFSMDRQRGYRRLVRVSGGAYAVLAEDDFVYATGQDYVVTVEAIGDSLRVYQDGEPVFDVRDNAFTGGRIGLYCWANAGARFSDVRVDDFGQHAPVAYRFSFTTSKYATVFHHLHSYQDETWPTAAADTDLGAEIGVAVAPGAAMSEVEARAFASFSGKVLGQSAQKLPEAVEVHRVSVDNEAIGLLVRGPEPIDWRRTALAVSHASSTVRQPDVPGLLKLTDVAVGGTTPNDETVTLLARDRANPAGVVVETLGIPGPLHDASLDLLLDDAFDAPTGLLFEERFGANALDGYRIVDAPGAVAGPSSWSAADGEISQSANIYAGSVAPADPVKAGTVAVTGGRWGNIRLTAVLRSTDNDAIGVVFRYSDDRNWYRFSMDKQRSYRRLVKCVEGSVSVLWEDGVVYDTDRAYGIRVDAYGDLLIGYVDDALLFIVRDGDIQDGQVGFYCWANAGSAYEALRIESLDASPLVWQARFESAAELQVQDSGIRQAPSTWTVAGGTASQTGDIWGPSPIPGVLQPGTVALLEPSFDDLRLSVRLRSTEGAIGVVFRYVDPDNWYRFSMHRELQYRRLVKCVGGTATVLWQDGVAYQADHGHELTIVAEGPRLSGWLDGAALFDVADDSLAAGRIGLYCWANAGAHFERAVVTDPVRRVGGWRIVDDSVAGPSSWRTSAGALRQLSNAHSPALPDAFGTVAIAGEAGWDDYRIVVRARSDDDDAIGVTFRWRDGRNHYRLSLDAQRGYRRLVKVANGVVSVPWEDAGAYTVGQPFTLTVDVLGDRLVGYQGDELLFDLVDPTHPTGRIGLYCWANTGARFERITVTSPPLDAYAVFRDRFGAGDLAAWTIEDEGTQGAPSSWAIVDGELTQSSNIYSDPVDPSTVDKRGTKALAGDPGWGDAVLTARLASTDDDAIGLLFRYMDPGNFYRFSMDRQRRYRRLVKCVGGTFTTLWEDATAYEVGRHYDVVIAAVGERLTGWIDEIPVFEVEDDSLATGRIGLYCWANAGARFSNVRLFRPDRLWTTYLLSDDFDWETAGLWSYDTAGNRSGPAVWETAGGELRQTSNVWGGSPPTGELGRPGTIALGGEPEWTDYRVTVRLRSDDDDAIGVVFRYADPNNWYRFSMDRQRSYRRLVKCVAGEVSLLWHDDLPYSQSREYLLTLDVVGGSIVGYLDGVELFSVRDDSLAAGRIGLYCWANAGARFSSVRVTEAGWSPYYRFGLGEETVAAGTRITVHSGNSTDWSAPPTPGLTRRFLAAPQGPGRRRLPTNRPVELRIRDGRGNWGHGRSFLPATAFTTIGNVEVLRKADGTEFALFVPAGTPLGSQLSEGQHRLRFTYRRDNTATDPNSIALAQAGDRSDEIVVLDVP